LSDGDEEARVRGVGVTYEERRGELIEAALRTVEQGGVDALTFRRVATEAGVSLGRVQHYFTNRTDLLRATYAHVQRLTRQRIEADLAKAGVEPSSLLVVRTILRSLVPTTPSRLAHRRVAQMFDTAALEDAAMVKELRTGHTELVDFLALQLGKAREEGDVADGVDPARAATVLLALASGLGDLVLIGHTAAPYAQDLLDEQLDRIVRGGS
jgi:AcrR family transcriptional regulator